METNYIKRVEFADVPVGTGEGGTTITMAFKENYYQKYDIFKMIENFDISDKNGNRIFFMSLSKIVLGDENQVLILSYLVMVKMQQY